MKYTRWHVVYIIIYSSKNTPGGWGDGSGGEMLAGVPDLHTEKSGWRQMSVIPELGREDTRISAVCRPTSRISEVQAQ